MALLIEHKSNNAEQTSTWSAASIDGMNVLKDQLQQLMNLLSKCSHEIRLGFGRYICKSHVGYKKDEWITNTSLRSYDSRF